MTQLSQRNQYPAELIKVQILAKHKKAVVVYGSTHFFGLDSLQSLVEQSYPRSFFVVTAYIGFPDQASSDTFEQNVQAWRNRLGLVQKAKTRTPSWSELKARRFQGMLCNTSAQLQTSLNHRLPRTCILILLSEGRSVLSRVVLRSQVKPPIIPARRLRRVGPALRRLSESTTATAWRLCDSRGLKPTHGYRLKHQEISGDCRGLQFPAR